jgi:hypothetical protein
MEFSPTPVFYVIVGALVGMVVGWLVGYFDSNRRASKKVEAAEANAEIKATEAEKKIAEAEQKLALAAQASPIVQDDPGLLRLKKIEDRFALEMDGAPVAGELSPDRKKRLIELITILRPLLEGGQLQKPAPQQAVPQQPVQPVQRPIPQQAAPQPVPQPQSPAPQQLASEESFLRSVSTPEPVKPVSPRPMQSLLSPRKPDAEKIAPTLSIVQQIDSVLQARLVGTPLAGQGIRLQESIQGGVEVYVGIKKFPTVDDVPDEAIKAAIRGAIAEWEKKFTPGM